MVLTICLYHTTRVSLCVREGQQRPSYGSPLVSISERQETDCGEAAEPDGVGWTTTSPNSAADNMEVDTSIISET